MGIIAGGCLAGWLAGACGLGSILGELTGDIAKGLTGAFGCLAAAFSVALVGMKATEAVGRNPESAGKVLVQSILGMALAEAIAFYALFLS